MSAARRHRRTQTAAAAPPAAPPERRPLSDTARIMLSGLLAREREIQKAAAEALGAVRADYQRLVALVAAEHGIAPESIGTAWVLDAGDFTLAPAPPPPPEPASAPAPTPEMPPA